MPDKIIILENEQDIIDVVEFVLVAEGYEVKSFTDVASYRDLVAEQPSLILLDHWLNGYNGSDICMAIKADPDFQNIPVILMSAVTQIVQVAASCGCDGYIRKPFDFDALLSAIKTTIANNVEI